MGRHGFEYKRNGTLRLFAALNTLTGEVLGKTASRHGPNQVENWFARIQRRRDHTRRLYFTQRPDKSSCDTFVNTTKTRNL